MKNILLGLLSLLFALTIGAQAASAASSGLPEGAQILQSVTISGTGGLQAVVFSDVHTYLGVLQGSPAKLVWKREVSAAPAVLRAPGYGQVFEAKVHLIGGGDEVYAYQVNGGRIRSAILSDPSGVLRAEEQAGLGKHRIEIWRRDTQHTGSIPYRFEQAFTWNGGAYQAGATIRVPDLPTLAYPVPRADVTAADGSRVLLRLEIANTEQERETGLMNRTSLDPDSGMLFVWTAPVQEGFWMQNTYVPLSVAFLGKDGTIQEIQDMQPLTTDTHTPAQPYWYALEVNQGFFSKNNIKVGDQLQLSLGS